MNDMNSPLHNPRATRTQMRHKIKAKLDSISREQRHIDTQLSKTRNHISWLESQFQSLSVTSPTQLINHELKLQHASALVLQKWARGWLTRSHSRRASLQEPVKQLDSNATEPNVANNSNNAKEGNEEIPVANIKYQKPIPTKEQLSSIYTKLLTEIIHSREKEPLQEVESSTVVDELTLAKANRIESLYADIQSRQVNLQELLKSCKKSNAWMKQMQGNAMFGIDSIRT